MLAHSDVVFMYVGDAEAYRAYGATFVGWGGAHTPESVKMHHDMGIRCTGSMWCLTAGAKLLHENPELLAAVSVDIEGKPVEVPWLFDHTHEGMKSYFGCTNTPAFREHSRREVRRVMAGSPDGLHVDDHCGVAASAWNWGGGLCDRCIEAFRKYLQDNADPGELKAAGVEDPDTFDYRDLIRKYATTREEYLKVQHTIPLMKTFLDFHSESAAENVRQLGQVAAETAGHPVGLSANACLPDKIHLYVMKHLTHIICEVKQNAAAGTRDIGNAIEAYRMADEFGKPMAATGSGQDWAFVKTHNCEELVRFWIALAYAHGQRFMVPHPTRQWCFTDELGTHWYEAPIEAYTPVYRFIRANSEWFDGFKTVDVEGARAPENVHLTLRRHEDGRAAIHLLNTDYDEAGRAMRPMDGVRVSLPKGRLGSGWQTARLLSYDAAPREAAITEQGDSVELQLDSLRLWTVAVLGS